MNENIKHLAQLAKTLDSYSITTREEKQAFLQDIINVIAQLKSATSSINKDTKDTLNLIVKQVNVEHDRILKEVKTTTQNSESSLTAQIRQALSDCKAMCDEIKAMDLQDGEDGQDGEDADEELIIEEVLKKIPKQELDAKELVDKINNGSELIDASKIKNLPQPVINHISHGAVGQVETKLKAGSNVTITTDVTGAKVINSTGGSTATFYTETPSGLIDGANKTYTVANSITMVMVFAINGQFLHPTTDYTVSGTTITMVNALDSSLSGTGFTIVYN